MAARVKSSGTIGSRRQSGGSSTRSMEGNSQHESHGGRRSLGPDPLWKTWDAKARKSGEHATVYHTNGTRYRGQYDGDMRHGQGTLLFKNGNKYEGSFENDLQHGFGTHWILKDKKLQMQYRGGFAFGKRQGEGVFAYADGGKYEGEWYDGKREGQGRMTFPDGTVYEGSWLQGMRHGPGTLFLTNGDVYQGEHAFDKKDGPGTFYYVGKNKRYDGVWSEDVAKCGLYGEIEGSGEASGLPELRMLEPMQVLEEQAFALQAGRTEALEASGIVSPGAQDRGSTGAATGAGAGASSLEGVQEEEGFEEEEEEGEEDYLHDGDEDLEDMEDAEGEWQE